MIPFAAEQAPGLVLPVLLLDPTVQALLLAAGGYITAVIRARFPNLPLLNLLPHPAGPLPGPVPTPSPVPVPVPVPVPSPAIPQVDLHALAATIAAAVSAEILKLSDALLAKIQPAPVPAPQPTSQPK